MFGFMLYFCLYLTVIGLQRDGLTAYQHTSTLSRVVVPQVQYVKNVEEVYDWLSDLVADLWVDPLCGDGICEEPFEFPMYGRFGCSADCGYLPKKYNTTAVSVGCSRGPRPRGGGSVYLATKHTQGANSHRAH